MQTTLKSEVTLIGIGVHSGEAVTLTMAPAPAGHGIWFRRTDPVHGDPAIRAIWSAVRQEPLCTTLSNADGVSISTVEHVMAALAGCGIHNVRIDVSGPEVPILDGSSAEFVSAILSAGVAYLPQPIEAFRVRRRIEVTRGAAWARLDPADHLEIAFEIDFPDPAIGRQRRCLDMANGAFVRELCDARTFCRRADVEAMHAAGKGLGGSLRNAVVVEGDRVLTPGGMRHKDEPVRHKMLDALGDLALCGAPLLARYTGHRAGHALTNALLRELFANPGALELVTCDTRVQRCLPGVGVSLADLPAVA